VRFSFGIQLTLPPVPLGLGWRSATRLAREHYIRLDSNDYPVRPGVIGRRKSRHRVNSASMPAGL
jgi:hypothetical protein